MIGRTSLALASVALLFLAVRWLGPTDYGAYMLIWGLCELAVPITSLGVLPAVQQFLPRLVSHSDQGTVRRFVRVMEVARLTLILAGAAVVVLVWAPLAGWLGLPPAAMPPGWMVALLMVGVLGSRFAAELLESLLEQRDAQWVRALQPMARLLALAGLWMQDMRGLQPLLWADVAVALATLVLGQTLLARRLNRLQAVGSQPVDWAEVRRFVGHLSLAQVLVATGDAGAVRMGVSRVMGPEAAGVFAFLQQLLMTANRYLPSTMLANVVRPMLVARESEGDLRTVGVGLALLVKVNVFVALVSVGVVWAGGDGLMTLAIGREAPGSALVLGLLLLGLLAQALSQVMMLALQVHRRPRSVSAASLMSPSTTVLAWLGSLLGGLAGAAAGTAVGMWLRGLVWLNAVRGVPSTPIDWPGLTRAVVFTLVAVGAGLAVRPWIGGIASGALCGVLLLGALIAFKPLTSEERELTMRALGRRRGRTDKGTPS